MMKTLLLSIVSMIILGFSLPAQVVINEYSCSNLTSFPDDYGDYEDFIELYNNSGTTVTIGGYYLSDDPVFPSKWMIPAGVTIAANGFKKFWCSGRDEGYINQIHTNFRLTQTKIPAESIVFSDPTGLIIEQQTLEITQDGHSRGRTTDGNATWGVFINPTPGMSNNNSTAYSGYTETPEMDLPAGFYTGNATIVITTSEPNVTIRYTTNGNEPIVTSNAYAAPVNIITTTVLKARAFSSDPMILPGLIKFNTYFIDKNHTLPVVSIAANQLKQLLNGDGTLEPLGSIEYFNTAHERTTIAYGDFGRHGQDSWVHPQRSLDYKTRDEYGYNFALQEKFFVLSDRNEFQRVILRAFGDDNYPGIDSSAHTRDDFVQTLSTKAGLNLDVRKSTRCVVYANGQFWGVYSIREKVDDHDYTSYYYNQGKYDLHYVLLWGSTWAEYGGQAAINDWEMLYNYIVTHNMSNQSNFDYVVSQYDPTSLVDYMLINSFVVCSDWLNWNVGWWKGLNPEGDHQRWGYILWDEDATFGHYINYTGIPAQSPLLPPCFHESLTSSFSDPEGHVTVLNRLLENPGFNQYYINRYADLMNTGFKPEFGIALLDSMENLVQPEMAAHFLRWGGNAIQWTQNVQKIRDFYNARYQTVVAGMNNCYNVTGPFPLTVDVTPAGSGYVQLNSLTLKSFPFTGNYYGNIDISLSVIESNPGYEFDHWETINHAVLPSDTSIQVSMQLTTNETITAVFVPRVLSDSLIINEINYHSAANFDPGDWVELYNPQQHALDITNWKFKDEVDTHEFIFPAGTIIPSGGFLVVAEIMNSFDSLFPNVSNYVGPMGFGLSGNGELIRLYNSNGSMVDTVHYDDTAPWPTEPDGMGPTLELISPSLDNALASSWKASCEPHGTPGEQNCTNVFIPQYQSDKDVSFLVYPNPFTTSASIVIRSAKPIENGTLIIYDLPGKEVRRLQNIKSNHVIVNREDLSPGVYLFHLYYGEGKGFGAGKLVVE
jgi:hypothetical protein